MNHSIYSADRTTHLKNWEDPNGKRPLPTGVFLFSDAYWAGRGAGAPDGGAGTASTSLPA